MSASRTHGFHPDTNFGSEPLFSLPDGPSSTHSSQFFLITTMSREPRAATIYATELAVLLEGFPLWDPSPGTQPAIEIADVGYVQYGGWARLFNASKPLGDPINDLGVPDGYQPLDVGKVQERACLPAKVPILSESMEYHGLDLAISGGSQVNGGFSFKCSKEQGAVLLLGDDADRRDTFCKEDFARYIIEHGVSWLNFANKAQRRGITLDDLVFVTGCDRTSSWACAAFSKESSEAKASFDIGQPGIAEGGPSKPVTGGMQHSGGALPIGSHANGEGAVHMTDIASSSVATDPAPRDQCVFLRGYKICDRKTWSARRLLRRKKKYEGFEHVLAYKRKDDTEDPGSGAPRRRGFHTAQDMSGQSQGSSSGGDGGSTLGSSSGSASGGKPEDQTGSSPDTSDGQDMIPFDSETDDVHLHMLLDRYKEPTLLDILLDYILENSVATFALVHDDDLNTLLPHTTLSTADFERCIHEISPEIYVNDQVGMLESTYRASHPKVPEIEGEKDSNPIPVPPSQRLQQELPPAVDSSFTKVSDSGGTPPSSECGIHNYLGESDVRMDTNTDAQGPQADASAHREGTMSKTVAPGFPSHSGNPVEGGDKENGSEKVLDPMASGMSSCMPLTSRVSCSNSSQKIVSRTGRPPSDPRVSFPKTRTLQASIGVDLPSPETKERSLPPLHPPRKVHRKSEPAANLKLTLTHPRVRHSSQPDFDRLRKGKHGLMSRSRFESTVDSVGGDSNDFLELEPPVSSTTDESAVRSTVILREEGKSIIHFQLGNLCGHGAFGDVYRALNLNTGQIVAIKRIRLGQLHGHAISQLIVEVGVVSQLTHPNILKHYGVSRDSNTLDIVYEYADNGSLAQTLKAFGKLNESLVASYVTKILEGLQYLHASQVVHGDLKAANVLTTKTGNVKLSDFGISLNLRAAEGVNNDMWMANWTAPEVIELKGASPASDIWSLACTIIELLTGNPPHADVQNTMSVMFHIVEDPKPPIPEWVSEALQDFLTLCFNKDPEQRPNAGTLFEHPWLRHGWSVHKELRPQDSLPFLRRVSADLPRSDVRQFSLDSDSHGYLRSIDSGSDNSESCSPRQHVFVKSVFSRPVTCRVCNTPVMKAAVLCTECSLIAHSRCAHDAPRTCDLRAQLLMSATSPDASDLVTPLFSRFQLSERGRASSVISESSAPSSTPSVVFKHNDGISSNQGLVFNRFWKGIDEHALSVSTASTTTSGSLSGDVARGREHHDYSRSAADSDVELYHAPRIAESSLEDSEDIPPGIYAGAEALTKQTEPRRLKKDSNTRRNGCVLQ